MPVSPALSEKLSFDVVKMYRDAERSIIKQMADNLAKGIENEDWMERKLAQLAGYRKQTTQLLADLRRQSQKGVESALTKAYAMGGLAAVSDIASDVVLPPLSGLRPIELLARETQQALNATHLGVITSVQAAYTSIINDSAATVLLGAETLEQGVQKSLDEFAAQGIRGFVDKRGRGWSMESYTEMAMRTATGKAAVQGHIDQLVRNGYDLVIVSDAPKECPLCRPWEGKVLRVGTHNLMEQSDQPSPKPSPIDEKPLVPDVDEGEVRSLEDLWGRNPTDYNPDASGEIGPLHDAGRHWLKGNGSLGWQDTVDAIQVASSIERSGATAPGWAGTDARVFLEGIKASPATKQTLYRGIGVPEELVDDLFRVGETADLDIQSFSGSPTFVQEFMRGRGLKPGEVEVRIELPPGVQALDLDQASTIFGYESSQEYLAAGRFRVASQELYDSADDADLQSFIAKAVDPDTGEDFLDDLEWRDLTPEQQMIHELVETYGETEPRIRFVRVKMEPIEAVVKKPVFEEFADPMDAGLHEHDMLLRMFREKEAAARGIDERKVSPHDYVDHSFAGRDFPAEVQFASEETEQLLDLANKVLRESRQARDEWLDETFQMVNGKPGSNELVSLTDAGTVSALQVRHRR